MQSTAAPKAPPTKPKKDRDKELQQQRATANANKPAPAVPIERLKAVVRRLPPNIPEDVFWESVQAWVSEDTATWRVFHPGKLGKKLNKENIPSRAYIAFRDEEQLAKFSREYDGHMFRDKTGNESQAVVEFAPYQKVPTEKKKQDARNATIEKDEDYISFLESLKPQANPEPASLETLIASSQPPLPPKTTPLLEALKAEKSANKDKEAILRNHAHYKDPANINAIHANASRKDDSSSKKKGGSGVGPGGATGKSGGAEGSGPIKKGLKKSGNTNANVGTSAAGGATVGKPQGVGPPKNASQASNNSINPPTTPKQPKPPRAPRPPPPQQTKGPQPAVGTAADAVPVPRRTRPMIGLASRQFEAALSGVGGAAAAGERKSRREKEREAAAAAAAGSIGSGAGPSAAGGSGEGKPRESPTTPKKERGSRKRGNSSVGGGAGGGAGVGAAAATDQQQQQQQVKVPSILQRIDDPAPPAILQREPGADGGAGSAVVNVAGVIDVGAVGHHVQGVHVRGGGGGARKTRGRGRGG